MEKSRNECLIRYLRILMRFYGCVAKKSTRKRKITTIRNVLGILYLLILNYIIIIYYFKLKT